MERIRCRTRGTLAALLTAACLLGGARRASADDAAPTVAELRARVEDGKADARARQEAATALTATFDPETLVPWLTARIAVEKDLYVWVGLARALAAQGEVAGLQMLVEALPKYGPIRGFIASLTHEGVPGGDVNEWSAWLGRLDPAAWKELQRQRHLPRVPVDADEAGLDRMIAWWDGLGMPDVGKLPFVRVHYGASYSGGEVVRRWTHAFVLGETAEGRRLLGTDLAETVVKQGWLEYDGRIPAAPVKLPPSSILETVEVVQEVKAILDPPSSPLGPPPERDGPRDSFGLDDHPPWRFQGAVLARAVAARGAKDLALRIWRQVAALPRGGPRYGSWTTLDLVKQDLEARVLVLWGQRVLAGERTWAQGLADFRALRARGVVSPSAEMGRWDALLERQSKEEAQVAADAASSEPDPAVAARRWVNALPVCRDGHPQDVPADSTDPRARLVGLGYAAVPALREALSDLRFTRSELRLEPDEYGYRTERRLRRMRELALETLERIAHRDFFQGLPSDEAGWEALRSTVSAWWAAFETEGEIGILRRGVLARDGSSVAQARQLVARFPDAAPGTIREALEGADLRMQVDLLAMLAPLSTPDVQAMLLAWAAPDRPLALRVAAAETLLRQGRRDGVERLLGEWPRLDPDDRAMAKLAAFLLTAAPGPSLTRMMATLDACPLELRAQLPSSLARLLAPADPAEPGAPPPPALTPQDVAAVERLVVTLLPDDRAFGMRGWANGVENLRRIGDRAAQFAAYFWPDRYAFDASASTGERRRQRFLMLNRWRREHGLDPVDASATPDVPPLPAGVAKRLVDAWLAAPDGAPRDAATTAMLEAGLGTLPAVGMAFLSLAPAAPERVPLDALRRRIASILREVCWSDAGPLPSPSLRALVEGLKGKPLTGLDLTAILIHVAKSLPEGATGIDFTVTRDSPTSGCRMDLRLTTHEATWGDVKDGFMLSEGHGVGPILRPGRDLDHPSAWWRVSLAGDLDRVLLGVDGEAPPLRRALVRLH